MESDENVQQPAATAAPTPPSDRPSERLVRHVFWKYPVLSLVLLVVVAVLAATVGSPNWPRDSIAGVTKADPGGAVLAFTQELDGTASSSANAAEFGMGDPGQVFVLNPLHQAAPLLGADVGQALATYEGASATQQQTWASNYDKALGTIMPSGGSEMSEGTPSPDFTKIDTLKGDFGPVPVLLKANVQLAQNGYLEQYLQAVDPGHSFHMTSGAWSRNAGSRSGRGTWPFQRYSTSTSPVGLQARDLSCGTCCSRPSCCSSYPWFRECATFPGTSSSIASSTATRSRVISINPPGGNGTGRRMGVS